MRAGDVARSPERVNPIVAFIVRRRSWRPVDPRAGSCFVCAMVDPRRDAGKRGEDVAETYLRSRRYAILARNWRSRSGEIDLVAEQNGVVVFVEVRSRSGNRFGGPLESVDARKQLRLGRLAAEYLRLHRLQSRVARFDVIGIDWGAPDPTVVHVERAFDVAGGSF